ncbi:MAG: hypothetical protein DBY04_07585 [Clostridiales bacterium]|nr:MAG: hypothetical protein DBY04_07585 [Clostridiales bacterium]
MFDLKPYERKNNVSSYNPFRDMEAFERSFFSNPFGFFGPSTLAEFKTDITDNGNEYVLEADLPGFKKEDIKLDINGDVLTVQAERHSEHEDKDKKNKYVRCERSYGLYSRQFDVSEIDTENIKAKYEDGVLKLTLPKKAEVSASPKRVEIE